MTKERLQFSDYCYLILILVIFTGLSLVYEVNQKFSFDQTQMLLKGIHAVVTGEYLPFGNEASTLGNLPGMLSSWVIGAPLQLYNSMYSVVVFQIALRVLSILFFINALAMLFGRRIVVVGTLLFALSPWLLVQTMLYNPAYLSLGATVALNMLVRLRNVHTREQMTYRHQRNSFDLGRMFASMILVLAVGFCLQLHFSWPVLAAIIGIMWLRRDIKVSYLGIALGLAIIALSLWPYLQEIMVNPTLLNNPEGYASERYIGYGLVHVYPVLKALLYWFRFGSLLVTKKAIVPEVEDDFSTWIVILCYAWIALFNLIGGLTVVFAVVANYFTIYRFRMSNSSDKLRFIRGMSISAICGVLIAAAASPVTLNFWQIAVIMPFALLPVLAYLSIRQHYIGTYVLVAVLFFAVANPLAAMYSDKFNINENFKANFFKTCLLGFDPAQCAPYSAGLSKEQVDILVQSTAQSPEVIDRVINGHIPAPIMQPIKTSENKAQEEAATKDANSEVSNESANAASNTAPNTSPNTAPNAASTVATSVQAPDSTSAPVSVPAPTPSNDTIVPVSRADAPITVDQSRAKSDVILDAGSGDSGELVIQ